MSTDQLAQQLAQVLKYVSAMAREVGEFRQEFISFRSEMYTFRDETNARLTSIEREQRQTRRDMNRVRAFLLDSRSEADELRERIEVLEEKKA